MLCALILSVALAASPAQARVWHGDGSGNLVGAPPQTSKELLEFCVANPAHCSLSVNHLSADWQRHLQADRLNPVASTYKLLTLLEYAQRVADGRAQTGRRLSRDHWAQFWIGADGEELHGTRSGPIVDESGATYRIRRAGGRRLAGALRRSWEYLRRPTRLSLDELAQVLIRFSDNAAADWFLYEFGERSLQQLVDRHLDGYHDLPPSIDAMFLTYFLNPDQPGRPSVGERMLSEYSGYEAHGYRQEIARWFARLEDRDYVARARSCQPAVLPWDQRIGVCPPLVGEPAERQLRELFNSHSVQSNTRTQTRLMTRMLQRDLLPKAAHEVAERALEYRLDPARFRNPGYRNVFRRYGAKSGSFRTIRGLSVLAWTAYFESQPDAGGATRKGAVTIHLRGLPGRQRDANGQYAIPDITFDLPLRFAEDVILNRDGLADEVKRLPEPTPRAELVARVRRLETHARRWDAHRGLRMEVQIRNIGAAPATVSANVALYLRAAAGGPADTNAEPADRVVSIPALAPGQAVELLFDVPVPAGRDFVSLVVGPENVVAESTKAHRGGMTNNVQWQRLRFATVNYRSIGAGRRVLDAGDGLRRRAVGVAGSAAIRLEGDGVLPGDIGRGDRLVLAPGTANEVVGHVASRDGVTGLILQQPLTVSFPGAAYTIQRAFENIQSWEEARQGDLVADQRIEVGVLYDDGPLRCRPHEESGCRFDGNRAMAMATIDGSLTNAGHYMALEVADGQRHRGTAGAGLVLDGENAVKHGIRVLDHYTRISGLAMRGFGGRQGAAAVSVERARNVLLEDLLIHDFQGADESVAAVRGDHSSDFTLRNAIIFDGAGAGVVLTRPTASGLVQNCTVYAMSGMGIREGDGRLDVRNTISMENGEGDFQVTRGTQDHNLSSDGSAAGPGSLTGRSASSQFRSLTAGARDLHLRENADAAAAGINLYPKFRRDIDGESRPMGGAAPWSMGADQ